MSKGSPLRLRQGARGQKAAQVVQAERLGPSLGSKHTLILYIYPLSRYGGRDSGLGISIPSHRPPYLPRTPYQLPQPYPHTCTLTAVPLSPVIRWISRYFLALGGQIRGERSVGYGQGMRSLIPGPGGTDQRGEECGVWTGYEVINSWPWGDRSEGRGVWGMDRV